MKREGAASRTERVGAFRRAIADPRLALTLRSEEGSNSLNFSGIFGKWAERKEKEIESIKKWADAEICAAPQLRRF